MDLSNTTLIRNPPRISAARALFFLLLLPLVTRCGATDPDVSVAVEINPANITVRAGGLHYFQATETLTRHSTGAIIVSNDANAFEWKVLEGANGGSLSADSGTTTRFLYNAPTAPGTYHVVVTDKQDPSETATAIVTVQ